MAEDKSEPKTVIVDEIKDEAIYSGEQVKQLIEAINEAAKDGAIVIKTSLDEK